MVVVRVSCLRIKGLYIFVYMTILTLKGKCLYIENPSNQYTFMNKPFWDGNPPTVRRIFPDDETKKYYTQTYFSLDSIYGYTINPMTHTVSLMIKYRNELFQVSFETQEEYDQGIECLTHIF